MDGVVKARRPLRVALCAAWVFAGGAGCAEGTAGSFGGAGSGTQPAASGGTGGGGSGSGAGSGGGGGGRSAPADAGAAADLPSPDGAGGSAGSGGSQEGGGGVVDVEQTRPPCISAATQVVVIGDSYVNYNEALNPDLAALAIADGALQPGEAWRMYAVPGSSMASGGIAGFIPDQFTQAVLADPDIIAMVMTGGGNDILIPNGFILGGGQCKDSPMADQLQPCQDIVQLAIDRASQLMLDAADAGVRDIVYFFYPHLPGGGLGGANPNVILDYAVPKVQAACDDMADTTGGSLRCHFIDLRPVFEGHTWIQADGIHPTAEGHDAMAEAIWSLMTAECIAQSAASGCCEP